MKPVIPACRFTRDDLEHARATLPASNRTYGPVTVDALRTLIRAHGPV